MTTPSAKADSPLALTIMVEERPRTLKVLEALSKMTEPSSPADIGIIIEVSPRDTGKHFMTWAKRALPRNQTRISRSDG